MRFLDRFPHAVREHEHVWIPMPDGVRLAARIWMPEEAADNPVPAILEYIPYRKRDGTTHRDSMMHKYFAGHGYAAVRVDLRGAGDSEGVLKDEYLPQELEDGVSILEWLARQPWCDGNVGMIGISWGGFNGLQIAAMRPPQLKAIITACSTDDRYSDDVHYMGGCLLGDNLSWASTMFAYTASPPDPALVGDRWRDMWMQRLEESGLWLENWLLHQRRDSFWKHGSICENWSGVQCPVMAVGGWADAYTNAIFRMLRSLEVPRQGLVGPWGHKYPHIGVPGPAIGFLQESLRWWDHWLKGIETGVMAEPMLRVWMQDSAPPLTMYDERPGRWVGEPSWPSPNIEQRAWGLRTARLVPLEEGEAPAPLEEGDLPSAEKGLDIRSPLTVGLFAGKWCASAAAPDLPGDQRESDGGSLVFQTEPLETPVEVLGEPVVELEVSSDKPVAMVAARLSDVLPNHKVARVTYGVLNLTHRESNERPEPLEPGRRYRVRVSLNDVGQVFDRGHRIRLAISTSYWPLVWPSPEPATLTIHPRASRLLLPVRRTGAPGDAPSEFEGAEAATPMSKTYLRLPEHNWTVHRDLGANISRLDVVDDRGRMQIDRYGWVVGSRCTESYSSESDDYQSVKGTTHWDRDFRRGEWNVRTVNHTVLMSDANNFYIHADLDAFEGERRCFTQSWDRTIPRDFV